MDEDDDKVYAYTISTKARDTSKEFSLDAANTGPGGFTKIGTSFYVYDQNSFRMYVYNESGTKTSDYYFAGGGNDLASHNNMMYAAASNIAVYTTLGVFQRNAPLPSGSYDALFIYDNNYLCGYNIRLY